MQGENKLLIPLAVIIAGALIGGAIYFNGRTGPVTTGGNPDAPEIVIDPISADDYVLGNPNAKLSFITFSDVDCPYCQMFDVVMRRIIDTYGKTGDIAWAYRHFPIDQLHPNARTKAESAECVGSLAGNDAFWGYMDILFTREDETVAGLSDIAASLGVDKAAFEKCLADGTFKQRVSDQVAAAAKAGARGTPYTVIIAQDGELFPINGYSPYDEVEEAVKTLLLETPTQ